MLNGRFSRSKSDVRDVRHNLHHTWIAHFTGTKKIYKQGLDLLLASRVFHL
jgi:hypothetical protein